MTRNKHITRNYDANRQRTIRYDDDDFLLQIYAYQKKYEQYYVVAQNNFDKSSDAKLYYLSGMTGLYTKNQNPLKVGFWYTAPKGGALYRSEVLYANTYKLSPSSPTNTNLNVQITIKVNKETILNKKVAYSSDVQYNRHQQYLRLQEGLNYIEYTFSPNTIFFGGVVKKFTKYEATREAKNSEKITMIDCEVEHTEDFAINTLKCNLMYYHKLDEELSQSDPKANPSGLVFDYRDEVNYYVADTNGKMQRVFGGYISTIEVDEDLTKISIECADRLIDMDRRYCLSEVYLKGDTSDSKVKNDGRDFKKNVNDWSNALNFMVNSTELPIDTNVLPNEPLVPKKVKTLATYGKKKYNKFTTNNVNATLHDDYAYIRNRNVLDKEQSIVIFDCVSKPQLLNDYPNLWIEYGMGGEVWEEKVYKTEQKTVQSGITFTVGNKADKITSATGSSAVKPLWQWIVKNIKHEYIENFYQTPNKTLSRKKGNCCCKAELLLDMCNYKGVTDLKYVHVRSGKKGHVFCRINGMIVDPSTSRGWGNYAKGYGTIGSGKTTNYPTKPF